MKRSQGLLAFVSRLRAAIGLFPLILALVLLETNASAQHTFAKPTAHKSTSSPMQPTPLDLTGASSFEGFRRYTSEQHTWLATDAVGTTYFRDVFVGGDTLLVGLVDQETWYATATRPDGFPMQWNPITFYVSYQGMSNCFVGFGLPTFCGSNELDVLWYTEVQCAPTGSWTMNFFDNGVSFYKNSFILLPQIPPDWTPSFSQANPAWATDFYDKECYNTSDVNQEPQWCGTDSPSEEAHFTIRRKGCMISAVADIFDYHAVSNNGTLIGPGDVNNALNSITRGWNGPGNVDPRGVGTITASSGVPLNLVGNGLL